MKFDRVAVRTNDEKSLVGGESKQTIVAIVSLTESIAIHLGKSIHI